MIIGVGCWRGTGATTTALLLAAAIEAVGGNPWLIEADPAGGVLGGVLHVPVAPTSGLEAVAFPVQRRLPAEHFELAAQRVGGVRVVSGPADPFRAHGCHTPRMPWPAALRELDGDVVVDVGTLRAGSPLWPLLAQLDVLLLTVTTSSVSVVPSDAWSRVRGRVSAVDDGLAADITRFVVVDAPSSGEAFSRHILERELGDRLVGWLPWSPKCVELMHRGARLSDRRLQRDVTAQAARRLAVHLTVASDEPTPAHGLR